jgi:outer membrane protein OmpA-like peptidoglycan-associated protein
MSGARQRAVLVVAVLATLGTGCAQKHLEHLSGPSASGRTLIALLPDSDGSVGRASVSNASGSADLAAARDATEATANRSPGPVSTLSNQEVNQIFGDALSALPPAPQYFILYFRFDSDELTNESRALVPEIQKAVKERSMPDIVVVGHTDTMGTPRTNFELGLKRATSVRNLLTKAGLDASTIDVTSLGETDPLIQTPDQTPEPRNRRVEIAVR